MPRRSFSRRRSSYAPRASSSGGGDRLTGGTRDVNPQYASVKLDVLNATATTMTDLAATGAALSAELQVPSNVLPNARQGSQVMEILRVDLSKTYESTTAGGSWAQPLNVCLMSRPVTTTEGAQVRPNSSAVIAAWQINNLTPEKQSTDLTDSAGHGFIFPGQKLYLNIGVAGAGNVPPAGLTAAVQACERFTVRILYRWKNISITEYVGVVTQMLA